MGLGVGADSFAIHLFAKAHQKPLMIISLMYGG